MDCGNTTALKYSENSPQMFDRKDLCKRSEEKYFHKSHGRAAAFQ